MGRIRKWILKLVLDEIKENGCEIGGFKVKVINGSLTFSKG